MVKKLAANVRLFREQMSVAGFTLGGDDNNAIVPVRVRYTRRATDIGNDMPERGITWLDSVILLSLKVRHESVSTFRLPMLPRKCRRQSMPSLK